MKKEIKIELAETANPVNVIEHLRNVSYKIFLQPYWVDWIRGRYPYSYNPEDDSFIFRTSKGKQLIIKYYSDEYYYVECSDETKITYYIS